MPKRKRTGRLCDSEKAILYSEYSTLRQTIPAPIPITGKLRVFLETKNVIPPSRKCVRSWVTLWDENDGLFLLQKQRKKRKNTKVDDSVKQQVKEELIKKDSVRSVALTSKFETSKGSSITLGKVFQFIIFYFHFV